MSALHHAFPLWLWVRLAPAYEGMFSCELARGPVAKGSGYFSLTTARPVNTRDGTKYRASSRKKKPTV